VLYSIAAAARVGFLNHENSIWYHIVDNLPIVGHSGSGIALGLFDKFENKFPVSGLRRTGRESGVPESIPSNPPLHADFRQSIWGDHGKMGNF